jgi:high-affinity K+ transport system ATPase subunit B
MENKISPSFKLDMFSPYHKNRVITVLIFCILLLTSVFIKTSDAQVIDVSNVSADSLKKLGIKETLAKAIHTLKLKERLRIEKMAEVFLM